MRTHPSSRLTLLTGLTIAALVPSTALGQPPMTVYEGARLIVGDGTVIESAASSREINSRKSCFSFRRSLPPLSYLYA